MKARDLAGALLVLSLAAIAFSQLRKPSDPRCATFPKQGRLDVNMLMDTPSCAGGKVVIQGAVNALYPDKKALMLIDLSEEDNCEDGCPIRRLPVSWVGAMPAKGERVVAFGSVKEEGQKFVFVAKTLDVLPKAKSQ